jgi:uncharacterized membrane protein YcaP (DUF421 family)
LANDINGDFMFVTLIRTVILYIFAIASVRVMGKRQIGELQPSDLVVTLLISQIISIPIQDTDIPLVNTLIPIFLLVGFEIITSVFNMKSIKFRTFMQGHPVVIINDGVLNQKLLKDLRFTVDDLLESLRQKDVFDISQVQYAIVETNGQISVLLKAEHDAVTRDDLNLEPDPQGFKCPVIIDGKIVTQDFKICNTTIEKVEKTVKKEKLQIKDVLLMTIDATGNHTIIRKENQ